MKTIIMILFFFSAISLLGNAQCTYKEIFPVELGISKFLATTQIASNKNIKENKEANYYAGILNRWYKRAYLNGDSVYEAEVHFNYVFNSCFNGKDNELSLYFVDDKLYKIKIKISFLSTDFAKCLENYKSLVTIFENNFAYSQEFANTNPDTKEQQGEGYNFCQTIKENGDIWKVENLSIEYYVKYEIKMNDTKIMKTGNVSNYVIEIENVNLNGTKLTNQGY